MGVVVENSWKLEKLTYCGGPISWTSLFSEEIIIISKTHGSKGLQG